MNGAVAAFLVIGAFLTAGLLAGLGLRACSEDRVEARCCLYDRAEGVADCWTVPPEEPCLYLAPPPRPVEVWL
jgi:hypothetical protein